MASGRKPDPRWAELRRLGLRFTAAEAKEIGLSATVLSQAVARGQIERESRGRYRFAGERDSGRQRRIKRSPRRRRAAPLEWLRFENFGVFETALFEFCAGINVLIGENGTGKSHAMQAAYSVLRAFHRGGHAREIEARVEDKLKGVFRPDDERLGRLVRRARGGGTARIGIGSGSFTCAIKFNHRDPGSFTLADLQYRPTGSSIFIPSRELLAIYEGFIGAYTQSHLSFSEVYFDTCVALNAPLTRGQRDQPARSLLEPLVEVLGGRVFEQNGRFYVQQGKAKLEAHLVSEGLRKIAALVHLVNNGSLKKNDLLFWDEPEANLNPALSKIVVEFLVALATQGVQVILATHDYAMTTRLSILAENAQVSDELIRFFSLTRTKGTNSAVSVEHAGTLSDLSANPILNEHEALYDFELSGGAR